MAGLRGGVTLEKRRRCLEASTRRSLGYKVWSWSKNWSKSWSKKREEWLGLVERKL
jgi:hypothetical protein